MTGYVQARPYETGPAFDVLATMASLGQIQRGQQASALNGLQLQAEQEKQQLADAARARQQAYVAGLPEADRTLASVDPAGYVGAMIDRLKPKPLVAVPEYGGVYDPSQNKMVVQGPSSVTWGDSSVGGGAGSTLAAANPALQPPAGGPGVASGPPVPLTPYAAGVKAGENTTGNPAQPNPNSTAVGDHQFLEKTWLEVFKKYRPDLARGKSDADILKLREQPGLSGEMADAYAKDNTAALAQAGFEATPVNLALAHRFGPAGALRVLQAEKQNPNAPLSSVMPEEVLTANPELRKMTISQGRAAMEAQMGGVSSPSGGAPPSSAAPDPSSYDIRYEKGKPTEYPGKPGYVVARDKATKSIIAVPAPSAGQTEAEALKLREERAKQEETQTKAGDTKFANENTLRDEFNTQTKDWRNVVDAYRRIQGAAKSGNGPGDMAMLYAYIRLLDPNTGVKEGEFSTAAAAGSFGERIQGAVQKVLTGGRLPPGLREEFLQEAHGLFTAQKKGADALYKRYRGIAKRRGLNEDNVVGDYSDGDGPPPARAAGNFRPPPVDAPGPGVGVTVKVGDASAPELPALPPGFRVVGP